MLMAKYLCDLLKGRRITGAEAAQMAALLLLLAGCSLLIR